MKTTIKLMAAFLFAGLVMASCGTKAPKERTLEDYQKEAEAFKSGLPESYVVLGECIDSSVQKVYVANNLWEYYKNFDDFEDFYDTTYLIVYNLQTQKKDTLMDFETVRINSMGFIDFYHLENGKLFFSVNSYRCGSYLSYIDINTDVITRIPMDGEYGICYDSDENRIPKIYVKDGILYYSKWSIINEDEAECTADIIYAEKEYSIHI